MNLCHHFLLSMPQMLDPNFEHTLTYICDHDERGALGLIINRTIDMYLGDVLAHMELDVADPAIHHRPVYEGGPVDPTHGLVLHPDCEKRWNATHLLEGSICLSSSRDILEDIAAGEGPPDFLVTLGHAGWGPGQLENELAENAWLTCPADPTIMFATPPEMRLQKAAGLLGVDLNAISTDTGHA